MKISIDAIDIPKDRARKNHAPSFIAGLAASMGSPLGQLEPITVVPNGNRFKLVKGAARIAAAKLLEWPSIEATTDKVTMTARLVTRKITIRFILYS